MNCVLTATLLIVFLCDPLMAQMEDDPVGQWLFQIEQQIRQDPSSSDRLIQRIGSIRDPDLLRELQRRWGEIRLDELSETQQLALFDIHMWLSFETGTFDQLTTTLRSSGLGDDRPDRWLDLANRLADVGAFDQARTAWRELEETPLESYRCRARSGRAHSHLQEGEELLNTATPTPPSPEESFRQAGHHIRTLLRDRRCHQDPENFLETLLKLVEKSPSSIDLLFQLDSSISPDASVRETPEWSILIYYQAVNENRWADARHMIGQQLEASSNPETEGTPEWIMAHLEMAAGEPEMARLQLESLREMPESDRFDDLTGDLFLWNQLADNASWYSRHMLLPDLPSDSLKQTLHEQIEKLNARAAGTLLYRLHQRSGHLFESWYIDLILETIERLEPSDPLVPYLHWASLQQSAWGLAESSDSERPMIDFRKELHNFLNTYPAHPVREVVTNEWKSDS